MERHGRLVSAETNLRNNGRAAFSAWSVERGYKKDREDRLSQLSFETPACQDICLGAELLSEELREFLEMAVE
jgi:hypothetical protein